MNNQTQGINTILLEKIMTIVVLCVLAVGVAGCEFFEYSNPFPDSYYSDNFIESIGFDEFSGYETVIPDPDPESGDMVFVTGSWDFTYRYTDWDQFDYMRFERASPSAVALDYSSVPQGLSPDAPVYRLEVVNLISGGHFESGSTGTWSGNGTAVHDPFPRISGTGSMRLDALSLQEILFAPVMVPGFSSLASVAYDVSFLYLAPDPFVVNVGSDDLGLNPETGRATGLFTPSSNGNNVVFQFEPETTGLSFSALNVDDFTMKRSGGMALRLRLRPSETTHLLEPGTWEFSVWVCADPDADVDGSTGPYPLDRFRVTMKGVGNAMLAAESGIYSYDQAAGWTRVTAILAGQALQYPQIYRREDRPVIDLILDFDDANPGSLLLAAPEFRFK